MTSSSRLTPSPVLKAEHAAEVEVSNAATGDRSPALSPNSGRHGSVAIGSSGLLAPDLDPVIPKIAERGLTLSDPPRNVGTSSNTCSSI